ncbi:MAG: PIN domain-containing protein [Bacteroidetes bacterium]|nr:MAG: PIN domain-containing protein [Bacteroidota bacterium]
MELIVDANVLFSTLISGKGIYKRMVQDFQVYSLDYIFTELTYYQEDILKKTKLDKEQFAPYTIAIFSKIKVLPSIVLSDEAKQKAYDLCLGIDLKDAPYVALAIQMNIPLLTRDKVLLNGLQKKKFKNILFLPDFIEQYM